MHEFRRSYQRGVNSQGLTSRTLLANFTPVSCTPGPAFLPIAQDRFQSIPRGAKVAPMTISSGRVRGIAVAYIWSIGFWLTLAMVNTLQERLSDLIDPDTPAGLQMHLSQALLLVSVRYISFALLTPPIFYLVRRFAVSWEKPLRRIGLYVLGAIPFVLLYASIRWTLAPIWSFRIGQFVPRTMHTFVGIVTGTLGIQISVYVALVVAAHAYEYFVRVKSHDLEQAELQQALAASELQALKSQIQPHFLFNTLHGISTLIDADRVRAKAMVLKLSSLLRTTVQHGSSDLITLHDELEFIDSYLDLEKMRLGSRLLVHREIDPATTNFLLPQLILQPLVENAVVHGIACARDGGWLEISAKLKSESGAVGAGFAPPSFSKDQPPSLEIIIRNSVAGRSESGTGLGLKNTEARLKYLYSGEASCNFSLEDNVATAILNFPIFISATAPAVAASVLIST